MSESREVRMVAITVPPEEVSSLDGSQQAAGAHGTMSVAVAMGDGAAAAEMQKPIPAPIGDSTRKAARAFRNGVGISSRYEAAVMKVWNQRLQDELEAATSDSDAGERLEDLTTEFLHRELEPKRYRSLLMLWAITIVVGCGAVEMLFGEHSVCLNIHGGICDEFYGHFLDYIAFRYAMYGVLLGSALRVSLDEARIAFGEQRAMMTRPALGLMLGSVFAYLLARLVAEGKLNINLFGVQIERSVANGAQKPFFTDSGALFLIGLAAGIASDVLLGRIIKGTRSAAEEVFEPKKRQTSKAGR